MRNILITIFFFLFSISLCNAQQTKQRLKIIQSDSSVAIAYATVQIKSKNIVVVSDENGYASIDVSYGDTIIVSALGYFQSIIPYSSVNYNPVLRVYLIQKNINLKEVTIKGINTKEDLKMAILRMRIEEKQKDLPGLKTYHGPMKRPAAGVMSPISMIYESEWAKKSRAKKWAKTLIIPQIK